MIGKIISHYKILEKLGEGGMGLVYKARDTKLDRFVALKFLPPYLRQDEENKKRFIQEAKAASALDHPNICTIYQISETEDGQIFIAMACYEGQSLRDRIEKGSLPIDEVLEIAIQIAAGLAKAHSKNIFHRDIKPANVIITNDEVVKIVDFGLAKLSGKTQFTKAGTTLGTVAYMSPEQTRGIAVDHRTDIWALGAVIYEMLTGRQPFAGDYEQAVIYSIMNEDPEPPTAQCTGVPKELERIVLKALAKEPDKRYRSVQELLTELLGFAKNGRSRRWRWRWRRPGKRNGLAILIIILLLAIAIPTFLSRPKVTAEPGRVLVWTFENLTGDQEFEPLGRMAVDWVNRGLTRSGLVEVVSTVSSLASFRALQPELQAVSPVSRIRLLADESRAGTIISGAYYLDKQELRFHAQITDVKSTQVRDAFEVAAAPDDPLPALESLQQKLVGRIAADADMRLTDLADAMTETPTYGAYREFVEGLDAFSRRQFPMAVMLFKKSAELDSTFLLPLSYAIEALLILQQYHEAEQLVSQLSEHREELSTFERFNIDRHRATLQGNHLAAWRAAVKMTDVAPRDGLVRYMAGVHATYAKKLNEAKAAFDHVDPERGWMRGWYPYWIFVTAVHHLLGEYELELTKIRKGVKQYPNNRTLLDLEGRALAALGMVKELNEVIEQSRMLRPDRLGGILGRIGQELRLHGYEEAALNILTRALNWYHERPDSEKQAESYKEGLALIFIYLHKWQEARAIYEELVQRSPDEIEYLGRLGALAAKTGDRLKAEALMTRLQQLDKPFMFGLHTFWLACIASELGEPERAVAFLKTAFEQGYKYGMRLHYEVHLQPLQNYKPFKMLIR